jgi:hypothetical protein
VRDQANEINIAGANLLNASPEAQPLPSGHSIDISIGFGSTALLEPSSAARAIAAFLLSNSPSPSGPPRLPLVNWQSSAPHDHKFLRSSLYSRRGRAATFVASQGPARRTITAILPRIFQGRCRDLLACACWRVRPSASFGGAYPAGVGFDDTSTAAQTASSNPRNEATRPAATASAR